MREEREKKKKTTMSKRGNARNEMKGTRAIDHVTKTHTRN